MIAHVEGLGPECLALGSGLLFCSAISGGPHRQPNAEHDDDRVVDLQAGLYTATFGEKPRPGATVVTRVREQWTKLKHHVGERSMGMPYFKGVLPLLEDVGQAVKKAEEENPEVSNLVWMKVYLRTEIPRKVSTSSRAGASAGQITLLWDNDPSIVNKVAEAINKHSAFVKVTSWNRPEIDRTTQRMVGRLDLEFKKEALQEAMGAGAGRPSGRAGTSSRRRTRRGG